MQPNSFIISRLTWYDFKYFEEFKSTKIFKNVLITTGKSEEIFITRSEIYFYNFFNGYVDDSGNKLDYILASKNEYKPTYFAILE